MAEKFTPQIAEVAKCFEDAANTNDLMAARQPLYRVQQLKQEMSQQDFLQALKLALLAALNKRNLAMVLEIINIGPSAAEDGEVKQAAENYLQIAMSNGWEIDGGQLNKFKQVFNI